ncbi:MAG: GIY-YIG nuclease family protein [Anaerotignum sp.]|nr:GIY-YIG nuclease family protein [Anaerotignum sp.]
MEKLLKKALKEQYKNRVLIGGVFCVKCNGNLNFWLRATTDIQGSKNRFLFSLSNNSCPEPSMIVAWNQFGGSAFSFEVLEEIQKKETQTEREFSDDVNTLLEIWTEKLMEGESKFGTKN